MCFSLFHIFRIELVVRAYSLLSHSQLTHLFYMYSLWRLWFPQQEALQLVRVGTAEHTHVWTVTPSTRDRRDSKLLNLAHTTRSPCLRNYIFSVKRSINVAYITACTQKACCCGRLQWTCGQTCCQRRPEAGCPCVVCSMWYLLNIIWHSAFNGMVNLLYIC